MSTKSGKATWPQKLYNALRSRWPGIYVQVNVFTCVFTHYLLV